MTGDGIADAILIVSLALLAVGWALMPGLDARARLTGYLSVSAAVIIGAVAVAATLALNVP